MNLELDLDNLGCGIAIYKNDSVITIVEANNAFYKIIGYSKDEMQQLFKNSLTAIMIDKVSEILDRNRNMILADDKSIEYEFKVKSKDGKIVYLHNNVSYDKKNDVFHVITLDITEKQRTIEVLKNSIGIDKVTNLPSYEKFRGLALDLLLKNQTEQFIILKMDINNFDVIREIFGVNSSRKLLKVIAMLFEEHGMNKASICRTGMGEFTTVLSMDEFKISDFGKFNNKDRLYELVKEYIPEMVNHKVNFHTGVYKIKKGSHDIDNAISKVAMAHKSAKKNNRKLLEYTDRIKECSILNVDITNRMEHALSNREFVPYIQPQYDINSKAIIGAEVLARWIIDDENIYYPNEFIPIFEKNGFIIDFDMFMLEYVCETISSWISIGYECVPIAINFSKLHFGNKQFVQDVVRIVDKYNVPHELILIEMTETAPMEKEEVLIEVLRELQKSGFKVAIDDFGSGYSSLSTLKDYSFNILKLDKGFFAGNKRTEKENNIVKHIVQMAKSLGMKLIAEGIETEEQVKWLQSMNCEIAQGYYFSHPITDTEFKKLLNCKNAV